MATAVSRIRSRQRALEIHFILIDTNRTHGPSAVRTYLESLKWEDVSKLMTFHVLLRGSGTPRKADMIDKLMEVAAYGERVKLEVEHHWGKQWSDAERYMKETRGLGAYFTAMAHSSDRKTGAGFRGCPLGTGTTEEEALRDFVARARLEYNGKQPLRYDMLDVVERKDRRLTADGKPYAAY